MFQNSQGTIGMYWHPSSYRICPHFRIYHEPFNVGYFFEWAHETDFRFLEDVQRTTETAHRFQSLEKPTMQKRKLIQMAHERHIDIKIMPSGMKRAKTNRTTFAASLRLLSWTVEMVLVEQQKTILLNKILENVTIRQVLEKLDDVKKKEPCRVYLKKGDSAVFLFSCSC
jgi:hypothetical protein